MLALLDSFAIRISTWATVFTIECLIWSKYKFSFVNIYKNAVQK